MKNEILSLKSIYRFLTVSDYPIFCEGIISKNNHTGLTLTKFWQDNLLIDFRKHKHGKIIWRTEGGRNRYISGICNRSESLHFYREYAEEIFSEARPENVYRQIKQFMSFLLERQFGYDAFMKKLPAYLNLIIKDDDAFSKEAEVFFAKNIKKQGKYDGKTIVQQAFFCSWLLVFLMFHALAGNGEGEKALDRLRNEQLLSVEELEKNFLIKKEKRREEVCFLSGKNTELCSVPLDIRHFFGREEELFELREMQEKGGRYLVSGIGGIGKTELMRQFLKCCEEEVLTDYICAIQYENNLMDSFIKAFPQVRGRNREENFSEALAIIRIHSGERILIVIDNMNCDCDEDEDIKILGKIPATIFVTSRCQKINDFETYEVKPISKRAGSLVFRDNYKLHLQKEDKQALEKILDNELWCHTLTLRLLGSVAASKNWGVPKLLEQLEKGEAPNGPVKQDGYEGLKQLYRRMYVISGLTEPLRKLLKIFTVLPYASYKTDFARDFLSGYLDDSMDMGASLEKLWRGGWLEKSKNGYAMHPFIAECVRGGGLEEKDVAPFFEKVYSLWKENSAMTAEEQDMMRDWQEENICVEQGLKDVTLLAGFVAKKVTGISKEYFLQVMVLAAGQEYIEYGPSREMQRVLLDIRTKCDEISANTKAQLYIQMLVHGYDDVEELEREYRILCSNPEVVLKLKLIFAVELSILFYAKGDVEQSAELAEFIWEHSVSLEERMAGCRCFSNVCLLRGDMDGFGRWILKGIEEGRNAGLESTYEMHRLLSCLCSYYLSKQNMEAAEKVLKEMQALAEKDDCIVHKWIRLFYQGAIEMGRGDEDYGMNTLRQACDWAEALFVGTPAVLNYANNLGDLAVACNKAGQREEASVHYKKLVEIYENIPKRQFDIQRILNNMGVMYLDWGKPEEALDYLSQSWKIGREMGGLPAAENANNLSRAWRMLGDREKELSYLEEAVPVLEQFYGGEHPKVVDAKNRLSE